LVDILTFDGFLGPKFHNLTPRWLPTHLSPLGWEHVNLTGDYIWAAKQEASENIDGMRPLRAPSEAFLNAA